MLLTDPYQTYIEGSLLGSNPVFLVVALYEGAIDAVRRAKTCFDQGDILGRGQAISKAFEILTELIVSLNQEKGGEISSNLKRLYDYMQRRLLEAHTKKAKEPVEEVEKLLASLLEAWRRVADQTSRSQTSAEELTPLATVRDEEPTAAPYGGYFYPHQDNFMHTAVSF